MVILVVVVFQEMVVEVWIFSGLGTGIWIQLMVYLTTPRVMGTENLLWV